MHSKLHLISDGVLMADGGGAFGLVGKPKWEKVLPPDEQNRIPQALWCPLLEIDGKRILIDCGIGDKFDAYFDMRQPRHTQIEQLVALGVTPDDIDYVILTHLHGDHCGWATQRVNGKLVPTFRNAQYFVQANEYADAIHPNERTRNTYFADNFVPLMEQGKLTLLNGDTQITSSVRTVVTPGHTMWHQSVIIEFPDAPPIFFVGDLACYMINFARLPWVTAYDIFPMTTIDTKRKWQSWAFEHAATLICAHEAVTPVGKLVSSGKGLFNVEALTTDKVKIYA